MAAHPRQVALLRLEAEGEPVVARVEAAGVDGEWIGVAVRASEEAIAIVSVRDRRHALRPRNEEPRRAGQLAARNGEPVRASGRRLLDLVVEPNVGELTEVERSSDR